MINQIIIDNCFNRLADGECDRLEFYYEGKKKAEFQGRFPGLAFFPPMKAGGTWAFHYGYGYETVIRECEFNFVPFDEIREIYEDAY